MSNASGPHVAIVGLMGVGKTTVAEAVSRLTGLEVVDSDRWIVERAGEEAAAIAEAEGVSALHALERSMLEETLQMSSRRIVTPAASVVDDPRSRRLLVERALVAWLDAPASLVRSRMRGGSHRRALSDEELHRLSDRRHGLFAAVADLRLDASQPPDRSADEIISAFGLESGSP